MNNFISAITNFLFGFDFGFDLNIIKYLFFCMLVGVYLKFILSVLCNQMWVRTYTQTLVFSLLPAIGFLITNVISNSIALSLGMVGALSVIRFRTPVKNPLELVSYFLLITIGIVINVSQNLALNFVIFLSFVIVLIELYALATKGKKFEFFKETESYVLNLVLKKSIDLSEHKKLMIHQSFSNDLYMYTFLSKDLHQLDLIRNSLNQSDLVSFSIDK